MCFLRKKDKICSIVTFIVAVAFFFVSCKEEEKSSVNFTYDPEVIANLDTDSMTMLVSDSGLIRYKVIAENWKVFDEAKEPHWLFPEGFYLEQFDTVFTIVATVKADTAWNFTRKNLWKLKGNVFIKNNLGETFSTEELFWDTKTERVYSDKYVEVNRPGKTLLRGTGGFQANQQMTQYDFYKSRKSEIYVNEEDENTE